MTVHFAENGITLCGYVPPNGWAMDQSNRWTDVPEQCSCAECSKVLQMKKRAAE
jgi:rubredoxin